MAHRLRWLLAAALSCLIAHAQTPAALRHVSEFSGADAGQRMQACIDALPPAGGTCVVDLQGEQRIARGGIQVGSPTKAVLLQFLKGADFQVTATDAKDVFALFDNSGMVCDNVGAIMLKGSSCRIKLAPGASVRSLITNGQKDGSQESLFIRGLLLQGDPRAAVASAAVELTGVYVPTVIEDSTIYSFDSVLLKIASTATPRVGSSVLQFRNVWLNGGHLPGARPLLIQGTATTGNGQIVFFGGAIEHQGIGQAAVEINGAGGTQTSGIAFYGTYFENSTFTREVVEMSRRAGEVTLRTSAPHQLSPGSAVNFAAGPDLPRYAVVASAPTSTTFTFLQPGPDSGPIAMQGEVRFGGSYGVRIIDAYNVTIEQANFWGGGGIDAIRVEETRNGLTHDVHVRDSVNAAFTNGVSDTRNGRKYFPGGAGKPAGIAAWGSNPVPPPAQ